MACKSGRILVFGRIIDGAIVQPPYYLKAVATGMRVLVNMQEMDIPIQKTGLNTTQRFIAKNPDVSRRVVKSVIEEIHLMRTNPSKNANPKDYVDTCFIEEFDKSGYIDRLYQ